MLLQPTLTALELAASGKQERAGRELSALEWSRADREPFGLLRYPYLRAVNRLLASRWLLEGGDSAQAVRLLAWHEAELSGRRSRGSQQVDGMLSGVACLELARIHAAQGRNELARYYYHQFLQRYDMPVPAHRHLVEEARIALARLEGRAKAPTESLR